MMENGFEETYKDISGDDDFGFSSGHERLKGIFNCARRALRCDEEPLAKRPWTAKASLERLNRGSA